MQNIPKRFSGLSNLYGDQGFEVLTHARVVVVGVGGVGSWVVEALARNAIGAIIMIDMDVVSESNINRQLPALRSTLGRDKTAVLKERILEINPECKVDIIDDFVSVENTKILFALDVIKDADFVIECIDNFRVKAAIISYCRKKRQPIITVGGAGGQLDPSRINQVDLSRTQHDALFAKTRKLLRQDYGFPRNVKRTFGVPCIYSDEQIRFPDGTGGTTNQKPSNQKSKLSTTKPSINNNAGLSCASGIGSSMQVTATFGLLAVAHVINKMLGIEYKK